MKAVIQLPHDCSKPRGEQQVKLFETSMRLSVPAALLLSVTLSSAQPPAAPDTAQKTDPIAALARQLDLERYKATIKGLTQFGDRRQGTDRNRAAIDWIEAQLKSYGCTNTERITYDYQPPAANAGRAGGGRGQQSPTNGPGGSRRRGNRQPEGVNNDPMKQPDGKLRALNSQPSTPG
jgi:hypothetical protein